MFFSVILELYIFNYDIFFVYEAVVNVEYQCNIFEMGDYFNVLTDYEFIIAQTDLFFSHYGKEKIDT